MGEASIQPGLVTQVVGVRSETGGLITPARQVLSQRGTGRIEDVIPLGIELVGPLAGEEAAMRRVGKRGWSHGKLVTHTLLRPSFQVGGGAPGIAVDAQ